MFEGLAQIPSLKLFSYIVFIIGLLVPGAGILYLSTIEFTEWNTAIVLLLSILHSLPFFISSLPAAFAMVAAWKAPSEDQFLVAVGLASVLGTCVFLLSAWLINLDFVKSIPAIADDSLMHQLYELSFYLLFLLFITELLEFYLKKMASRIIAGIVGVIKSRKKNSDQTRF